MLSLLMIFPPGPLLPQTLAAILGIMMNKKTFMPWRYEHDSSQAQEETRKLQDTIKQNEKRIGLLEKENAELKNKNTVPTADRPMPLRNVIFKSSIIDQETHRERELQLERLHNWIGENFVNRVTAKYEWFALWRMLYDKKMIEGTRAMTSKFVRQMNEWYADAPCPCDEGAVNRFRSGYLGQTPFSLWSETAYLSKLRGKQSYNAFRTLYGLCEDLKNTLKTDDFYK